MERNRKKEGEGGKKEKGRESERGRKEGESMKSRSWPCSPAPCGCPAESCLGPKAPALLTPLHTLAPVILLRGMPPGHLPGGSEGMQGRGAQGS